MPKTRLTHNMWSAANLLIVLADLEREGFLLQRLSFWDLMLDPTHSKIYLINTEETLIVTENTKAMPTMTIHKSKSCRAPEEKLHATTALYELSMLLDWLFEGSLSLPTNIEALLTHMRAANPDQRPKAASALQQLALSSPCADAFFNIIQKCSQPAPTEAISDQPNSRNLPRQPRHDRPKPAPAGQHSKGPAPRIPKRSAKNIEEDDDGIVIECDEDSAEVPNMLQEPRNHQQVPAIASPAPRRRKGSVKDIEEDENVIIVEGYKTNAPASASQYVPSTAPQLGQFSGISKEVEEDDQNTDQSRFGRGGGGRGGGGGGRGGGGRLRRDARPPPQPYPDRATTGASHPREDDSSKSYLKRMGIPPELERHLNDNKDYVLCNDQVHDFLGQYPEVAPFADSLALAFVVSRNIDPQRPAGRHILIDLAKARMIPSSKSADPDVLAFLDLLNALIPNDPTFTA